MPSARIVGPGRAGRSLAQALSSVGWEIEVLSRSDQVAQAASGVDAVVIATPDGVIAEVAAAIRAVPDTVVLHLSGSTGPDVLAPHPRRAALHPLVPLPNAQVGAERLLSGVTYAVAGDPLAETMARSLGGRVVRVADQDRVAYHAAACVAANHVVALLGQVQRVAAAAGLDLEAFLPLARAAVDDVGRLGPVAALTGPAARGDWRTLEGHLAVLDEAEAAGYTAGVALALRLASESEARRPEAPADPPPPAPVGPSAPQHAVVAG